MPASLGLYTCINLRRPFVSRQPIEAQRAIGPRPWRIAVVAVPSIRSKIQLRQYAPTQKRKSYQQYVRRLGDGQRAKPPFAFAIPQACTEFRLLIRNRERSSPRPLRAKPDSSAKP